MLAPTWQQAAGPGYLPYLGCSASVSTATGPQPSGPATTGLPGPRATSPTATTMLDAVRGRVPHPERFGERALALLRAAHRPILAQPADKETRAMTLRNRGLGFNLCTGG